MNGYLPDILLNHSVVIASVLAALRYRIIRKDFQPFIFFTWLGLANETLSLVLIYTKGSNAVNSNVYVLHAVFLDGLEMLLNRDGEIEIVGLATEGRKLVDLTRQFLPDVVLTDLKMPGTDGIQAIKEIKMLNLPSRCIAISTFDTDHLIVEALEAGALGYIIKNAQRGEIIEAIKTVNDYNYYYCKTTSLKLAKQIAKSKFNPYKK